MTSVAPIWKGETVICIAGGPSLTPDDVDFCRGRAHVIAVNDAYRLAPWADVLYAADAKWWRWHRDGVAAFAGLKFSIGSGHVTDQPSVMFLRDTGKDGIETATDGLRTGMNSGYQAINLAVHFGAARILLLGYDMSGDHWFGSHRDKSRPPFAGCIAHFRTMVAPLKALGVEIVNCSRRTAIDAFVCASLEESLQ